MKHRLSPLPYSYDALEPFIDARTMEIHHTKHHQAYVDKLNAVLEKHHDLAAMPLEEVIRKLPKLRLSGADKAAIRNNGGGHLNHTLFWNIMGPRKEPDAKLVAEIKEAFGSLEEFKQLFSDKATTHFGSGWTWLVRNRQKKLEVYTLPNQDSPYLTGDTPIITLDLWEHAYYLKYQNRRAEYIKAWWSVLRLLP